MLLLDDTKFFQSRRFKWLRYFVAASVVIFYFGKLVYNIAIEAVYVSQYGPFARGARFIFGFDDLIVALLPAAVLVSDFEVISTPKTHRLLRTTCIIVCIIAILTGFLYLLQVTHMLDLNYFELGIAAHILRHITIFFAAIYFYNRITLLEAEEDIIND